jgi:hypothetical protein
MSSAFAITAPRISDEDDELERRMLTEEEREAVERDLRGESKLTAVETPEAVRSALERFEEAL